jgi:hypothetical protein
MRHYVVLQYNAARCRAARCRAARCRAASCHAAFHHPTVIFATLAFNLAFWRILLAFGQFGFTFGAFYSLWPILIHFGPILPFCR